MVVFRLPQTALVYYDRRHTHFNPIQLSIFWLPILVLYFDFSQENGFTCRISSLSDLFPRLTLIVNS